ncbi:MAG TPA: GatB/YqeY domain-containing protein [Tepidisphaeraceae bacterium]|nr:GatB/YqeY domain-containing protein [Tepidisphaeraceae bacterium]
MDLLAKLTEDMKAAMKSGQKDRLSVIRMLLADVKIIDLSPKPITPEQAVEAYAKKLRKSKDEYEKIGRTEEAAKIATEITVVEEYLPKRADAAQTEQLVDTFLAANSFTEKQVGQAMGAFMKQHGTAVDPEIVNPIIRQKLAGK